MLSEFQVLKLSGWKCKTVINMTIEALHCSNTSCYNCLGYWARLQKCSHCIKIVYWKTGWPSTIWWPLSPARQLAKLCLLSYWVRCKPACKTELATSETSHQLPVGNSSMTHHIPDYLGCCSIVISLIIQQLSQTGAWPPIRLSWIQGKGGWGRAS